MRLLKATAFTALLALHGLTALAQSLEEGLSAFQQGDFATALQHLEPLAKQDDARAQYNLGVMYHHGWGVTQDDREAVEWFRSAAEQGHTHAQSSLAVMYRHGRGVTQNYSEAVRWYRRAAEQGEVTAQFNLGSMYALGQSVAPNPVLAYMLENLAAAQGNKIARFTRNESLKNLTPEQITEGQRLASEWQVGTPLPTETDTWP